MLCRWQGERCVGEVGSIPRLGFRGLCMQDSPLGIRFGEFQSYLLNLPDTDLVKPTTSLPSQQVSMWPLPGLVALPMHAARQWAQNIAVKVSMCSLDQFADP